MLNKKGVSGIVATLITILLVLVASGVIYVVSMNLISDYREDITNESSSLLDTCASKHYSVMGEGDLCNSSVVSLHNQICCPSFYFNTSSGLVSYWSFDENANDNYGNNDGTVVGATYNSTGGVNGEGAYEFDGSGDYIDCGNDESLNIGEEYSITTWIKDKGQASGNDRYIIGKSIVSGHYEIIILIRGTNNLTYARVYGTSAYSFAGTKSTSTNWTQIAVTYKYPGQTKIYINATLISSMTSTREEISIGSNLHIGDLRSSSYSFNGTIDEVRIYNQELSETKIKLLYDNLL